MNNGERGSEFVFILSSFLVKFKKNIYWMLLKRKKRKIKIETFDWITIDDSY